MNKVLFILKRRLDFNAKLHSPKGLSTGLFNSANFMVEMLTKLGVPSAIEVAVDNNCIDRFVREHNPTHVVIEALWVVPHKFYILTKLHPNVKWIIRLHSELPFLAGEGIAFDWLGDYVSYPNIDIGVNAPRMLNETQVYLQTVKGWSKEEVNRRVYYMPNYYPQEYQQKEFKKDKYWIDVACFGAIRPLKNHMVQAVAALKFARSEGKQLRFHINQGRIEMQGSPVLNNLRGFFQHLSTEGHQLIGHQWRPREEFLELCSQMDIGMQCNFSETFNIVSADLISQGIPVVGSKEIPWATRWFNADPTNSDNIADIMRRTYHFPQINVFLNQRNLAKYTSDTKKVWLQIFGD